MNKVIFIILVLISNVSLSQSIDYLDLTSVLLRDGNLQRAKAALVKAAIDKNDDIHQFYLLNGILNLRLGDHSKAMAFLNKVNDSNYTTQKYVYTAETFLAQNHVNKAIISINKVSEQALEKSSIKLLKAKIYLKSGRPEVGYQILVEMSDKKVIKASISLINYLMDKLLYEEAYEQIVKLVKNSNNHTLYAFFSKKFLADKEYRKATELLEYGVLKTRSPELIHLLAATYDLQKYKYVAADIYVKLAYLDEDKAYDASEYLKQNKRTQLAHIINMSIPNSKLQLKQRLSIYLEENLFDLASSMEDLFGQYGAFKNDDNRYAMAYSHFMLGKYEKSINLLKTIKSKKLLNKSTKLMEMASDCTEKYWECYGQL